MSDYRPTTEEVRDAYVVGMVHDCYWEGDVKLTPDGVYEANRFNAWLTEYTRVKQAEALEEAASSPIPREALTNGTRAWLRTCAAEYRKAVES